MVYCTKCGTKNRGNAKVCKECGESLISPSVGEEIERRAEAAGKEIERKAKTCFGPQKGRERHEEECFGLPRGGTIVGIIIGLIIIFAGINWILSHYYDVSIEIGPFVVIIFGVLILAGALYGLSRR